MKIKKKISIRQEATRTARLQFHGLDRDIFKILIPPPDWVSSPANDLRLLRDRIDGSTTRQLRHPCLDGPSVGSARRIIHDYIDSTAVDSVHVLAYGSRTIMTVIDLLRITSSSSSQCQQHAVPA